ncbi:apoptosis-inducing factor 3-like [Corticium candelabrum]|uniref:apoptosis-inducing factor 3-like n=1 Tax=Corticium candelabrum TaxID=121492 RepID=UPI002E2638FF|nr:apoptosis-inducing factor 3-like [Corticium candelabrum]
MGNTCSETDTKQHSEKQESGLSSTTVPLRDEERQQDVASPRTRFVVARRSQLREGEMREVDVGDSKALLVCQNGRVTAIGHKCTHYGAPLVKGALGNGRVRCPWHGACFNVITGDIEDFPGLDGVSSFEVVVDADNVIIETPSDAPNTHKRTLPMVKQDLQNDSRVFLLIGGGGASVSCAETLRQQGFKGRIIIASKETDFPYDRPKLTKAMSATGKELQLRSPEFFLSFDIEVQLSKEVTGIDLSTKTAQFSDHTSVSYDKVLIATGGIPRSLNIAGSHLKNIYVLRTPQQANDIISSCVGKNVVIIGSSFISMESAATLSSKASSVTVVGRSKTPFAQVLGEQVGQALLKMHKEKGNKFVFGMTPTEFVGDDDQLTGVTLSNGQTLAADICLIGAGVVASTDFLKGSGVPMTSEGYIIVDEGMKAMDNVFSAGDIAYFPLPWAGQSVNIGHWQIAHSHGRVAAKAMLGKDVQFDSIPFFWSQMFGKSIRYCGYAQSFDDVVIDGSLDELKFAAYYISGETIHAVAAMNRDPLVSQVAELMYANKMPPTSLIRDDPAGWLKQYFPTEN